MKLTLLFLLCVVSIYSKSTVHSIYSINKNNPFHLQDIFSFDNLGGDFPGEYQFFTIKGDIENLTMVSFSDEPNSWPEVMANPQFTCAEKLLRSKSVTNMQLSKNRTESIFFTAYNKPYNWHFVLAGCDRTSRFDNLDIQIAFNYYNPGGFFSRHFSKDEQGILQLNMVVVPIFLSLGIFYIFVLYKFIRSNSFQFILFLHFGVYTFYFTGVIINIIHLLVYAENGVGIKAFGILSTLLKLTSETFIIFILFIIASGWAITFPYFRQKFIIGGVLGVYSLLLIVLFLWAEFGIESIGSKPYIYTTWPGILLSIFRFPLLAYFLFLIITSARAEPDKKKYYFYIIFGAFYSVWFIIQPIFVILRLAIPLFWWRTVLVSISNIIFDFVAILGFIVFLWPSIALYIYDMKEQIDSSSEYENSKLNNDSAIYKL